MNPHALSNFIAAALIFNAGLLATLKNKNSKINFLFFLLTVSAFIWQVGTGLAISAKYPQIALIGTRIGFFGIALIPILSYHLCLYITATHKYRILIAGYMIVFLFFIPLSWTALVLNGVYNYPWGFFFKAGPLHPVFLCFFIFLMLLIFYNLFMSYRGETNSLEKNRKKYFLMALLMAYIGSVDYLPTYGIQIYPFGYLMLVCFILIFAYAILRYQLMDIEVAIKKTVVFASLFAVVFGIFIGIMLLMQRLIAGGSSLGLAISSIIIIFTVRPLENLLIRLTDKYLFQKKYNYRELLKTFATEVLTVIDLNRLVKTTAEKLSDIIRPESCAVLLFDKDKSSYWIAASQGIKDRDAVFGADNTLCRFLKATQDSVIMKSDIEKLSGSESLLDDLNKIRADILFPMTVHDQMMGAISLGTKKSGGEYSEEDIDILISLAKSAAIAISNAELFIELSKTQAEAAQKEKMAVIGTLAAGINHEICNPLGIIVAQNETLVLHYERGIYKDKSYQELFEQAVKIMKNTIEQAHRATGITTRLSSFAKPVKDPRMDAVDVEDKINNVMVLLGHELELNHITFVKKIPIGLPRILVDSKQIEEIFFNLIRNAVQAIDKPNGAITVEAKAVSNFVDITIADTGCGISEEGLTKIYNTFHNTKGPHKGTGLGLYIVRQIVERNKGKISVKSKVDEGTTFTLEFQKSPEGIALKG